MAFEVQEGQAGRLNTTLTALEVTQHWWGFQSVERV